MCQFDRKQRRPLATLITELQQAVITEGNRLRGSLDALTRASASSAAHVADPPLASGAASSVEQPAATGTAAESTVKRPMEAAIAAQPGRRSKAPRKGAVMLSRPRSLATIKSVNLTKQIRDIIEQGPPEDLVVNFDTLPRTDRSDEPHCTRSRTHPRPRAGGVQGRRVALVSILQHTAALHSLLKLTAHRYLCTK